MGRSSPVLTPLRFAYAGPAKINLQPAPKSDTPGPKLPPSQRPVIAKENNVRCQCDNFCRAPAQLSAEQDVGALCGALAGRLCEGEVSARRQVGAESDAPAAVA